MEFDNQCFCCSLPWNIYYAAPLLRGRFLYVKDTAAEKEFDITMSTILEHVSSEVQENRNGQKN